MISRTAKTNRLLLFIEKIIVVILFFAFSICFLEFEVSAKETDKAYMDTSDATNKIYPNIEKFVYEIDEMIKLTKHGSRNQIAARIKELEKQMKQAAKEFDFEKAIELRDIILEMKANLN